MRGEPTPEYWDSEDEDGEDDEDEDEEDDEEEAGDRSSQAVRIKAPARKRKRAKTDKDKKDKTKKLRLRVKAYVEPPCCLCPNDIPGCEILSTDDGRKAHKLCALYLPETYIETVNGEEMIFNVTNIEKARLELKCLYCRSKRGACFQCSQKKCPRSYHATCAAAAGIFVEEGDVPVFDKDGVEYKEQAFEFSCRFHRTKRDKQKDGDALDEDPRIKRAAAALKVGEICQMQFYRKEIFAGVVVENRQDEQTLLLDIVPHGYDIHAKQQNKIKLLTITSSRVEVEWKWLLVSDPSDYHLPKASANALPMPSSRKAQEEINAKRSVDEPPRAGDIFAEGPVPGKDYAWSEFHTCEPAECKNNGQAKIDFTKENQVWHYLGKTSTEAKAQYTEDPRKPKHNPKANFLDSVPKPLPPPRPQYHASYAATHPAQAKAPSVTAKTDKPYVYKPRKPVDTSLVSSFTTQKFAPNTPGSGGIPPLSFGTDPRFTNSSTYSTNTFSPIAASQQSQQTHQQSTQPYQQQQMQEAPRHVTSQFTPFAPSRQSPAINPAWLPAPQANAATTHNHSQSQTVQRQQFIPPAATTPSNPFYRPGPPRSQSFSSQPQAQAQPHVPQGSATPTPSQAPPQHAWQKFTFFQAYHNR